MYKRQEHGGPTPDWRALPPHLPESWAERGLLGAFSWFDSNFTRPPRSCVLRGATWWLRGGGLGHVGGAVAPKRDGAPEGPLMGWQEVDNGPGITVSAAAGHGTTGCGDRLGQPPAGPGGRFTQEGLPSGMWGFEEHLGPHPMAGEGHGGGAQAGVFQAGCPKCCPHGTGLTAQQSQRAPDTKGSVTYSMGCWEV